MRTVGRRTSGATATISAMRAVVVVIVLGLVIAGCGATHTTAQIGLPDCKGAPEVRPSEVTLTCADGGLVVSHLHWAGWGGSFAAGEGLLAANDCKPDCAEGGYHFYPVLLTVSGGQQCTPSGRRAYATVRYWFGPAQDEPFPPGSPGAMEPTTNFPCKSQP